MYGDELLEKAKEIAPDTQRLLIADHSDFQMFIHAINSAEIHACMPLPFSDKDFFYQVTLRCRQYETSRKLKNLQKTTQRQNNQLSQIAENFKKKEARYKTQSDKQRKELRILKSRSSSSFGPEESDKEKELKDILLRKDIHFNPKSFGNAFSDIKHQINQVVEIILSRHGLSVPSLSWEDLLGQLNDSNEDQPIARQALPILLKLLDYKEVQNIKLYENIKLRGDLDKYFEISLSPNKIEAHIRLKSNAPKTLALFQIKRFLETNRIIFGVKPDHLIEEWLYDKNRRNKPFLIALGKEPKPPKDAKIKYHFPTNYLRAGKVNPDGSIDFRERGDIPHVGKDELLASKTTAETGTFGIDIEGTKIQVEEPVDWEFSSGPGTRISEEENKIYSTIGGQPHLDPLGTISVCTEYQIKGDIGFETGNIEFDGNVTVTGSVMQGFKVKCTSLTAKEICGAEIDVSGDLNVSMGIVDTKLVNVRGTVQAKFIHNSQIHAFGDVIVQKEIIDSEIYLSGACINERGVILNSKIFAKMGIKGGTIGNKSSQPSILTAGVDEHTNLLVEKIESKLTLIKQKIWILTDKISPLDIENQNLHAIISQNAHIQDRAQIEIKRLEKELNALKDQKDKKPYEEAVKQIEEFSQKAKKAERKIDQGFERQDEISLIISEKNQSVKELEINNKSLIKEKKNLLELSSKKEPLPEVSVSRHIQSRTRILTANAAKTLSKSSSRCRIREIHKFFKEDSGPAFYEIDIGNY